MKLFGRLKKKNKGVSFKDSMDVLQVPVITLRCGKKALNFILDSGADIAYINQSVLKDIEYKDTKINHQAIGIEGNAQSGKIIQIPLNCGDKPVVVDFIVHDLSKAYKYIEDEVGITIHGALGSIFLAENQCILDYKRLEFYPKG